MISKEDNLEPIKAENVRVDALKGGIKLSAKGEGRKVDILIPIEHVATLVKMLNSAASLVPMMSEQAAGQREH